jgi:hypothetical protein
VFGKVDRHKKQHPYLVHPSKIDQIRALRSSESLPLSGFGGNCFFFGLFLHGVSMSKSKSPQNPNAPVTIPKQTHNQVERLLSARDARQQQKQDLGISLRVLFMCGLPLKSMKEIYYRRSCGLFALKIFGDPEFGGIPYGQDRLVLIWVASAFVHLGCPENNTIEFLYLRDVLRTFGIATDGRNYQRIKEGFFRVGNAHFAVTEEFTTRRGKKGYDCEKLPMLRGCKLWERDPQSPEEERDPDAPHRIRLDYEWADEIREHPVPIDLHSVKALRTHPGALDFYQWQAWRSYFAKTTVRIPIFGPGGLLAQLGCLQGQEPREVRRRLKEWQTLIKLCWPTCPNTLSRDGDILMIRPGQAITQSHQNRFLLRGLPGSPK